MLASGGPDGLHSGPLRSLVAHGSAEAGSRLLSALTDLVNVMLRGEVPRLQFQYYTVPTNAPLGKKDGGIRPITVGSTIRRLSVKVGSMPVVRTFGS